MKKLQEYTSMVRVASIIILLSFSMSGKAQHGQTFAELITILETRTEFNFSYPQSITSYRLNIPDNLNFEDTEALSHLLEPIGIKLVVRRGTLVFKKLSNKSPVKISQPRRITGFVRDAASGENLIGAYVIDPLTATGVTTNLYGFFSLTVVGDSLSIGYVGFEKKLLKLDPNETEVIINLAESQQMLNEVVVTDKLEIQDINRMSTISLSPNRIKSLPVFMGESDVLKALQLLPGVQSGGEGSTGMYVRGGGPDQNLILLDGVPVYNANHLYGFFSVFNTDALNGVQLIKGGFPARYGGRLSSVIDIQMKEGNMNKFEAEGAVGLIASKLTISGPNKKKNMSYMLSARRTYLDVFTVPIAKAANANQIAAYNFWDVNAKINRIISSKDRIYLSAYTGQDRLYQRYRFSPSPSIKEQDNSDLRWGNITSAFRWNHRFTESLFSNLTAIFARYQFDLENNVDIFNIIEQDTLDIYRENRYFSNIHDLGIKYDFNYYLNNKNQVRFGASFVRHSLKPGVSQYKSHVQADTTFGASKIYMSEYYLYAEDDISLTSSTKINLGLHYSGALVESQHYSSLQPRITMTQKISDKWSVKASYAEMAQYIHLLVNSGVGLPTDLWVPSTDKVRPQFSRQYALGLATTQKGLSISLEGYYKEMANLIEYRDGAGFLDIVNEWEDKVAFGEGTSYGLEFLIRKDAGKSTGWIGYTWSKTDRLFPELNYGRSFPYRYDRRHDLSVVYNLTINERMSFGAVWVYGTGNAVTLPTTTYPKAVWDTTGPNYEESLKNYPGRNSSRMRDYHRLDVNFSISKAKKWGERTWVFGFYNTYSRLNPAFIDFEERPTEEGGSQFKQLSLFPIIPNISYQFKF